MRSCWKRVPGRSDELEHFLQENEEDSERFNNLALVIFDQAKLAEGTQLEEPANYVARLNELLLELVG